MTFSLTDSIGKKIYIIIGTGLLSCLLLLLTGIISSVVLDKLVLLARAERDHSVLLNQSLTKFEKYMQGWDEKYFISFMNESKKVCDINEAFGNIKTDLKSKSKEDVARHLSDVSSTFNYAQAQTMVTMVSILSNHKLVEGLLVTSRKANKLFNKYRLLADKFVKTENLDTQHGLYKEMQILKKEIDISLNHFSKGISDLSAWATSLIFKAMIGCFVFVFGFSLFIGIIISRAITRPINEVVAFGNVLADKNLSQNIKLESKDETARLGQAMNHICDKIGSSIEQVALSAGHLADGASKQAAAIEETSSALEEIASVSSNTAAKAKQADGFIEMASKVVGESKEFMQKLITSMKELAESSEKTQAVVKTIDEIAFQTNLLALNASVEAARAGEAGAGFTVVAEEVRSLAKRSADSAQITADLIDATVNSIKNGSNLVEKTGKSFEAVIDSTEKIGSLLKEMAEAAQQQSQGIEQSKIAVYEVEKITQDTAAKAEELSAGMGEFKTKAKSST